MRLCIDALSCQTLRQDYFEIIIVNNDPDHLPDASHIRSPQFRYITESKPGSYAARNAGINAARGSILVFTDSDCIPSAGWLDGMWKAFEDDSEVSLVAGAIEIFEGENGNPNIVEMYELCMGLPQRRYVRNGSAATANLAVRKEVFDLVGLFDDARLSGGDMEFTKRATTYGLKMSYHENCLIYHPARSRWGDIAQKTRRTTGSAVAHGKSWARLVVIARSFAPRLRAMYRLLLLVNRPIVYRLGALIVLFSLWNVRIIETVRVCAGKPPERQ